MQTARNKNFDPQPDPHPQGTTVDVRDLFYNTLPERKFLKNRKNRICPYRNIK